MTARLPVSLVRHSIWHPSSFVGRRRLSGATSTAWVYLLYHLLTRSYPVRARRLRDLRLAHEHQERTPLATARPDPSPKLARVIERTIHPQGDRYPSANALAADLVAIARRPRVAPLLYGLGSAASLVLLAWIAWELRGRPALNRITSDASPAILAAGTSERPAEPPVIAVLPLKNLGEGQDSDYFVDGLTDEIIRNLAVIDGLHVRSSTSSFAFKGKPRNVREVGEQLGANLVVEGSVLRSGGRLRINAQLIQVAGDVPLWSERFDRELKDVFAIQDEISRAIVNRLRLTLGRGQRRYDTNLETYDLYLKARALNERRGNESSKEAAELFRQVVGRDPAFAPAYAGLAQAYAFMSTDYFGLDDQAGLSLMRPAAERALQLDPLSAEAHAAMGHLYSRERDWQRAQTFFQRAIDLNPTLTQIHTAYTSTTLVPLGKLDEAERLMGAALRADPLSLGVRRQMAILQIISGKYEDAIDNLRQVQAVDPEFPFVELHLLRALTFAGRLAEALPLWERGLEAISRRGDIRGRQYWMAPAYVMAGRRAEVERWPIGQDEYPYRQAVIYAALGDKDRAFEALDRTAATQPQRLGPILMAPEMAVLRGDPRLAALRKKLKLL